MPSTDGPVSNCPEHGQYSLHTGCFGCASAGPKDEIDHLTDHPHETTIPADQITR